ncbi:MULTISPECIES: hypothetical protein [Pseudomonas]|uniref:Uncharacterized protein n=1 Tax=Pseudomonas helleri TaxID=1608996 RepID=A0A7X2BWP0_9PSED|nr:hypothetical protein [Pseudomonas helleri]MQT77666.1 hypothetical protein [Pseudomonas helleri]
MGELQKTVGELQRKVGELLISVGELQKKGGWVGELQKTARLALLSTV